MIYKILSVLTLRIFKGSFCSGDLQHFAEIVLLYSFASLGVYIDRMDMIAVICKRHKYT